MVFFGGLRKGHGTRHSTIKIDDFEGLETIARRRKILLPYSPFILCWHVWVVLLVLYNSLLIPLTIGFIERDDYQTMYGLVAWDTAVDIFFLLDIIVNFRTAYPLSEGGFEIEPVLVAKRYLRTWFSLDLVATLPIEWIYPQINISAAKIVRLLRLGRLSKNVKVLQRSSMFRFIYLGLVFSLFTHLVACLWWRIGLEGREDGWQFQEDVVSIMLARADPPISPVANFTALSAAFKTEVPVARRYLTSLYWALTMVMKSPWLPPGPWGEQVFSCVLVVLGVIVFAIFIGIARG